MAHYRSASTWAGSISSGGWKDASASACKPPVSKRNPVCQAMRSAVPPFHRLRSSTGSRCEINNVSDVKIDEHIEAREKAGNNASRVKIVDEIARERICSTLRDFKHYNNGRLDHKRMHTRCSPRGMPVGLRQFGTTGKLPVHGDPKSVA
jgi:hypothetical protein